MASIHSANLIPALMPEQGQIADSFTPIQYELRNSLASVGQ